MSFFDQVERVRDFLQRNRRVSVRGLQSEFGLEAEQLEELIEELVEVQEVAERRGRILIWRDPAAAPAAGSSPERVAARGDDPVQSTDAERRQLTVMFCDLVGSTELSERLDAEDLREVVRAYQGEAAASIERFGGHIAQYLGDGILVYFGYPQAREDSAESAVRSGLEILERVERLDSEHGRALGVRLAVRVGVHTGSVVVGRVGAGSRQETLALGSATNIAARLQGVAAANQVVLSAVTERLVAGRFELEDLGTPELKGVATPMAIHRVVRAKRDPTGPVAVDAALADQVGRDAELARLERGFQRALQGRGSAIQLSGEAGLGKSRLAQSLRSSIRESSHHWLESHCTPYTQGSGFRPLIELLRRSFQIDPTEEPETQLSQLERALAERSLPTAEVMPPFADLLSLPAVDPGPELSPELRRRKTEAALSQWLLELSRQRPLVLLVEDLHWSDPSTLQFLRRFLGMLSGEHVLVLVSFRSGFEPPWRSSLVDDIELRRLAPADATRLVRSLAPAGSALPEALIERIVARADGVPIFLEELTQMMIERGGEDLEQRAIPETLHDLLMARLDRLGAGKQVAQLGSVLGREFPRSLLDAVSTMPDRELEVGLGGLVEAGLLLRRDDGDEPTLSFRHALIQDAAYGSLLKKSRREIHARTARVLGADGSGAVDHGTIARHFDAAGLAAEAIRSYRQAAAQAKGHSTHDEAVAHLQRALEILSGQKASPERDREELDLRLTLSVPLYVSRGWADSFYGASLERARELALELDETTHLGEIWMGLFLHHQIGGRLSEAESCARRCLQLAEDSGNAGTDLMARASLSQSLYLQGQFGQALEQLEEAMDRFGLGRRSRSESPEASVATALSRHEQLLYQVQALCLWSVGFPDRALELADDALALAVRSGHPFGVASAQIYRGWILQRRGEWEQARTAAEAALELCLRHGFSWLAWATTLHGSVRLDAAELEQAAAEIERGNAALEKAGTVGFVPHCFSALAEVQARLGRFDHGLVTIERGLALAQSTGQHYEDSELLRLRGELLRASAGDEGALELAFQQALETARRQGARSFELRAATGLAELWRDRGEPETGLELLAPLVGGFTEGLDTVDLVAAKRLLRELQRRPVELGSA